MDEDMIYNKLLELEKMMKSLIRKEVKELNMLSMEDKKIGKMIKGNNYIFNDPVEWKIMVSEICSERQQIVNEKEAVFKCRITKEYCDYNKCPKNKA